ncbi:MAG: hypothetical protein ABII22_06095 [Candidatus Micrarchaeota archaeon]
MNKIAIPSLLVAVSAFLPFILIYLVWFGVLPSELKTQSVIVISFSIGILLALFSVYLSVKYLNEEKTQLSLAKTMAYAVGLGVFIIAILFVSSSVLQLGKSSLYLGLLGLGVSGYVLRSTFKDYTFKQKELYWGLLGGVLIALLNLVLLAFSIL